MANEISIYQVNVGSSATQPNGVRYPHESCRIYRNGKLVTYKRAATQAQAVVEAVKDVRMCRRGGMLVQG